MSPPEAEQGEQLRDYFLPGLGFGIGVANHREQRLTVSSLGSAGLEQWPKESSNKKKNCIFKKK